MQMTDDQVNTLAANAYRAYGGVTDHKNYQGLPMPKWSELPPKIQDAWKEAVRQVKADLSVRKLIP